MQIAKRKCCICLEYADKKDRIDIGIYREDCLKGFCLSVGKSTDAAHKSCLESLGLRDVPRGGYRKDAIFEAFIARMQVNMKAIVQHGKDFDYIRKMSYLDAFAFLNQKISESIPIKKKTSKALQCTVFSSVAEIGSSKKITVVVSKISPGVFWKKKR